MREEEERVENESELRKGASNERESRGIDGRKKRVEGLREEGCE